MTTPTPKAPENTPAQPKRPLAGRQNTPFWVRLNQPHKAPSARTARRANTRANRGRR